MKKTQRQKTTMYRVHNERRSDEDTFQADRVHFMWHPSRYEDTLRAEGQDLQKAVKIGRSIDRFLRNH